MAGPTSLPSEAIELQIAIREAEMVRLQSWMGAVRLSFDDFLGACNLLALLEHDLEKWKALRSDSRAP